MSFSPFPHHYTATASARPDGADEVRSPGLTPLAMAAPAEFGGPGDRWSPETLLVATVAECIALTFKGVAAASKLPWQSLDCEALGTLERVDRVTRFTSFDVKARLEVPSGVDPDRARRLLHKADQICLVSNSLNAEVRLEATVIEVSSGPRAEADAP